MSVVQPSPASEQLLPVHPLALNRVIVDSPSQDPGLDFPRFVSALVAVIKQSKPRFAVGVFGTWGSGKTTLMEAIARQLARDPAVICVDFSAWRYEKEPHLIVPLIDTIRQALLEWSKKQGPGPAAIGIKAAEKLGLIAKALLAGLSFEVGLPQAAKISFDANKAITAVDSQRRIAEMAEVPQSFYFASFEALKATFKEFGAGTDRRLVVFIDDLDRCLPKGALEILESMKLFFDLDGFIFVVGLDRKVVEWCVEASYLREFPVVAGSRLEEARVKGAEYINKIFQVPFTLPPVSTREINDYVLSIIRENNLSLAEQTELLTAVRPHLDFLAGTGGVNPRRVKQYINDYILQRNIKSHLHHAAVLTLLTINYREDWLVVRSALYADDRDLVVAALRQSGVALQRQALEDLDPDYVAVPNDFLTYVAAPAGALPAGPGRALLLVQDLDEYIFAGETTRPAGNPDLLQLLPRVSRLRRLLEDAVLADGTVIANPSELLQQLSEIGQSVQSIAPGTFGALASGNLQTVLEALQGLPADRHITEQWRTDQQAQLRAAKRTLLAARESAPPMPTAANPTTG